MVCFTNFYRVIKITLNSYEYYKYASDYLKNITQLYFVKREASIWWRTFIFQQAGNRSLNIMFGVVLLRKYHEQMHKEYTLCKYLAFFQLQLSKRIATYQSVHLPQAILYQGVDKEGDWSSLGIQMNVSAF